MRKVTGSNPVGSTPMFIGAHVSIAGGFDKCIDRIVGMGGNCLMTFASSPRSLQTKEFSETELDQYTKKKIENKIGPHFFHGVYLVNLATEKPDYLEASVKSLLFYQRLAAKINGAGTIFHIGSHKGKGLDSVYDQICSSINQITESTPPGPKLILENAAGHAGTIGDKLEELARILDKVGHTDRVGICLDTQHAFASGYPISSLVDTFDSMIGLRYLSAIHLNDSIPEFGSRRDRHANWGEGKIGLSEIANFINDPRLREIPMILEVPGEDHKGPRKIDVDQIKSLVK